MKRDLKKYFDEYTDDYGFEREMVRYRKTLLVERLKLHAPKSIVEIGCGSDLLLDGYEAQGGNWERWIVVEPIKAFADAVNETNNRDNVDVIVALFEDAVDRVRDILPSSPDMLICSSLMHEVPDPLRLLKAASTLMGPNSILHVNVPNGLSFHRQLAVAMGLIDRADTESDRNRALQQPRVYTRSKLHADIEASGLNIQSEGGYFIKPFTHQKMERVSKCLGRAVLDGLYEMGKTHPELASELYVECKIS